LSPRYKFDRLEFAGSLGDLGTLLPIAIAMILINGLDATGLMLSVGLFYILAGMYYGVTVPVQPMKVIGAYAIATGISASQIVSSGLMMGIFLLIMGVTGAIDLIGIYTPKAVVRGVQLSTGALLMAEGVRFMAGTSRFQVLRHAAEPYLNVQAVGPVPIGIPIGILAGVATLLLLNNKRFPAGLVVVIGGLILGLILGNHKGFDLLSFGFNLPRILPFGWPGYADFTLALLILVLPQAPMTLGNAVIAYVDLSRDYFGEDSSRVTNRATCVTMALANFGSFLFGGMPICHGAGGLAAHYRFGARTAGSNLMIGFIFLVLAVLLGNDAVNVLSLLPMAILGVLLLFAGSQLALAILDMKEPKNLFVSLLMLGVTLASNLAVAFIVGFVAAYALKSERLSV
jgi:sulfate permease, SulP family